MENDEEISVVAQVTVPASVDPNEQPTVVISESSSQDEDFVPPNVEESSSSESSKHKSRSEASKSRSRSASPVRNTDNKE